MNERLPASEEEMRTAARACWRSIQKPDGDRARAKPPTPRLRPRSFDSMRTVSETHAGTKRADTEVVSRVHIPALELWPDDPDPDPRPRGVWRGSAAILIAGLATIVLISAGLLETTHRVALGIWFWLGVPLLLLASAAARVAAGRAAAHASDSR